MSQEMYFNEKIYKFHEKCKETVYTDIQESPGRKPKFLNILPQICERLIGR